VPIHGSGVEFYQMVYDVRVLDGGYPEARMPGSHGKALHISRNPYSIIGKRSLAEVFLRIRQSPMLNPTTRKTVEQELIQFSFSIGLLKPCLFSYPYVAIYNIHSVWEIAVWSCGTDGGKFKMRTTWRSPQRRLIYVTSVALLKNDIASRGILYRVTHF
jgi:hypothetical protein